jgi:hypothetical protein
MSINGNAEPKYYVLSGFRRLSAAKELKLATIPSREVFIEGLEAERFLIESNRQQVKTKAQRLREFKRLKEIETTLAKEREKVGRAKLPHPESAGRAKDKAAATAGLKPRTAEKGLAALNKAESGDVKAKDALEDLERRLLHNADLPSVQ